MNRWALLLSLVTLVVALLGAVYTHLIVSQNLRTIETMERMRATMEEQDAVVKRLTRQLVECTKAR